MAFLFFRLLLLHDKWYVIKLAQLTFTDFFSKSGSVAELVDAVFTILIVNVW